MTRDELLFGAWLADVNHRLGRYAVRKWNSSSAATWPRSPKPWSTKPPGDRTTCSRRSPLHGTSRDMPIAEQTVLEAALTYAGMGWKLLPGTVCRDGALINPLTGEKTDEITVHARGEATTDPDRVRQWWDVPDDMRPDILGAADESIGFVLVRDYLAETITASPWFTAKPTPVVGQKGLPMMAVFIVRPPFPQARSDIRPFPHGALIRLPPSPNVSWLVSPWQTNLTFLTATEFAELVTLTEITAP